MGYMYILLFMFLYLEATSFAAVPCERIVCWHGGTCLISSSGESYCECSTARFYGKSCEMIKPDPCERNKCSSANSIKCRPTNDYNSYTCECKNGYGGEFCEQKIQSCKDSPCLVGECLDTSNGFKCRCPPGYKGINCEININECKQRDECEKLAGNGRCDKQCNFPGCNYDGGDCSASNPDPFGNCSYASFCKYVFRDNHCDEICNNEGCLFDGFDCQEKTPTKCPLEKQCLKEYGNGKCNPECNSAECGWDGGDCISEKKELSESLVLTLITDPKDFIANSIASRLLITLSQLLHASVHYQLDLNGNPMIYEWSSSTGQGSLLQIADNSHSITKRSVDVNKKGVKVYLILDVSVCQQLSSLGASMQMDVQINYENQHCFTNAQSAAAMLAADSVRQTFDDLNIGIADATVMPRSPPKSSIPLVYIIFGVIIALVIVAVLINATFAKAAERKFITTRDVFLPSTSDELPKRQNMLQHQKRPYGHQRDRQSLIGDVTTYMPFLYNPLAFVEPAPKRFREEEPQPPSVQNDRTFTELHQHAASAEPISDAHIKNPLLIPCAKVVDTDGRTCIHWAIECVSDKPDFHVIEDIKKLVSIGCPIDAQDDSGATALHLAVRNGRTEVATYLLGQIDVNVQDNDGRTALFDAVSTKSLEMVQRILSVVNVDVNVIAYTNDTALIKCCRMAVNNDMLPIAEELLRHPSIQIDKVGNKRERIYSGRTAIHEAAACNSIQILKLLINRGAVITVHDAHEQTPLFLAVQSNQIEAVKLLIYQMRANRVEFNASNDCGETPLQIALSKGYTEIAEFLQNAGTQMPIPSRFQVLPSAEHLKFPEMKAIAPTATKASPPKPNTTKKAAGNKKRKGDSNVNGQPSQKQTPNNLMTQRQVMEFYLLNNPMLQMPQFFQMNPSMLQYPNNYHQVAQPQSHQYQQQQFHPEYYLQLQQPQMNPSSNYSSNPPSAHLPQCSSTSQHVSSDSAYGSPNSYQNSTNTSGQSDTSAYGSFGLNNSSYFDFF